MRIVWKEDKCWRGVILGPDDRIEFTKSPGESSTDESALLIERHSSDGKSVPKTLARIQGGQATQIWAKILSASDTYKPIVK